MSDTVNIRKEDVDATLKAMKEAEDSLDRTTMIQTIHNRRRQADYDMSYQDWASHSIRVMASYTLLLVGIFIVLFLAYYFGGSIKQQVANVTGIQMGSGNQIENV